MALSGFKSSGIAQAKKAKKFAGHDKNLVQYLDDLIVKWEKEEAEARMAVEAEREKRRQEAAEKRAQMEKTKQDLIKEGSLKDEPKEGEGEEEPKDPKS